MQVRMQPTAFMPNTSVADADMVICMHFRREVIHLTSGRIRIAEAEEEDLGSVQANASGQLAWAARVAKDAGQRSVVIPLVASLEGVGWKERRQINEGWYGSWVPKGGKATIMAQLPRNMVAFESLAKLLDALDASLTREGSQVCVPA
jgi:hypothetical protein